MTYNSDARLRFDFYFISNIITGYLIVYRVAKGRAMTTTLQPSEQETAQIRFNDPPSSLVPHSHSDEMALL